MRACFLGQNVCALGFGVAMVQIPPLREEPRADESAEPPGIPAPLAPNPMFEALRKQLHYS